MKILQLISSAGFFGAENMILELSKGLSSENISNIIGIFENSHNPHIELYQQAKRNNLEATLFRCNGKFNLTTVQKIRKFAIANRIEILHSHGYKSNIYGFLAAKTMRKPIVSTCHNWIADDLKTRAYYKLDKFIISRFDKIVTVSMDITEELLRNNVKNDKISMIYNGVDLDKFVNNYNMRSEFNIVKGTKVVGTVARFTPEKGLFNLLQAAREILNSFPEVRFMLVGDGPLRQELEKRCIELGIRENVFFTGQRSDMPGIYSSMDIFVLPSLREGFPMVILEAMAAKKPIVASSVGSIPKIIDDGKNGILISPGSSVELKKAINYLLKNERISDNLAANAYHKVTQEFSSQRMCSSYIEIYQEVLKKRMQ